MTKGLKIKKRKPERFEPLRLGPACARGIHGEKCKSNYCICDCHSGVK